jgi:hypothetical protein
MNRSCFAALCFIILCHSHALTEERWGDLRIEFVLDGKPPASRPIEITKDQAVCGATLPDDLLIVADDGGLANVVVRLLPAKGGKLVIHPDYEKPEERKREVTMRLAKCRFDPHVVLLRVGQKFVLEDDDPVAHNAQLVVDRSGVIPANGGRRDFAVEKAYAKPVSGSCAIHPWESCWMVIDDHPYAGKTDGDGVVQIKNLPVGKHRFTLWHERIQRGGAFAPLGSKQWSDTIETEIVEGLNDLGAVLVRLRKL